MQWQTTRFQIDLTEPKIMGIVNVTPDSFSDGGHYFSADEIATSALAHSEQLIADGADLLDIGGESTRPGAPPVSFDEELRRVLPVLQHAVKLGVPISIDTSKSGIMRAALDLGVDVINDVWALRQPGARDVVAAHASCGVCLMHMHREPQSMQASPMTGDVIEPVCVFLANAAQTLMALGVAPPRIVVDPGIGFGKTVAQNFSLLAHQQRILSLGFPVMAAWSRKSSLAAVARLEPNASMSSRLTASVAAALLAVERGARVVRVHDVRETAEALAVLRAAQVAPSQAR
jgi:dihydropteroate synthase